MRQVLYEKQPALIELYQELAEAEKESELGAKMFSNEQVMEELRNDVSMAKNTQMNDLPKALQDE